MKNSQKWLGEGAKGVLGQGRQRPLALVQKRVAPVQNRVLVVQMTLWQNVIINWPGVLSNVLPLDLVLGMGVISALPNNIGHKMSSGRHESSLRHAICDQLTIIPTMYDIFLSNLSHVLFLYSFGLHCCPRFLILKLDPFLPTVIGFPSPLCQVQSPPPRVKLLGIS